MRTASAIDVLRLLLLTVSLGMISSACHREKADTVAEKATSPAEERSAKTLPASWPTYHGATSLDGWADIHLPDTLEVRWRVDLGAPILTTPVADAERIYVADAKGEIHAVSVSGHPLWSKSFAGPAVSGQAPRNIVFDAPLALFESTLVACSADGAVYALDAATGEKQWTSDTDAPILGTPNFAIFDKADAGQKRLFVIDQSQGVLQSLDVSDGTPAWKSKGVGRCDGSPAVNADVAVFGSCVGALHVFSSRTGEWLRDISIGEDSQVASGVALLADLVFSGSRNGTFVHANVRTGALVWVNKDCDGEAFSTPAVHGDVVVFSANNGNVYALERENGFLRWRVRLGGTPSSPVLMNDKVGVTTRGTLYVLRLADGERLWSYEVSDEVTSPALIGALVVVGSKDGALVAFGPKQGG